MAEKKRKENISAKDSLFNDMVKNALHEWLENLREEGLDLNFGKLAQKIQKDYAEYGIDTSEQKLRQMFDVTAKREVKLAEVVVLSHLLQIPIGNICRLPNAPATTLDFPFITPREERRQKTGITKLENKLYQGDYYAYYFKPKHKDRLELKGPTPLLGTDMERAVITIETRNGQPYLILKEQKEEKDFYEEKDLPNFSLEGKLYLIEKSRMAYSFITDVEARRAMVLMFEYKNFSRDILFYRTAAMLTISLNDIHVPLFQKIALFRVPQDLNDPEQLSVLRGTLSMNTGSVMVEKDVFEKALDDEEYRKYKLDELDYKEKTFYVFSEAALLDSVHDWTADEAVKIILKLREMSNFQTHEIVAEHEYFGNFMRNYQQEQMRKK